MKKEFQPEEFKVDVCIAGTGLPECLIAASLSARGYSVLQIDKENFYGSGWATLNYQSFKKWISDDVQVNDEQKPTDIFREGNNNTYDDLNFDNADEELTTLDEIRNLIQNECPECNLPLYDDQRLWVTPFQKKTEEEKNLIENEFLKSSNKYNFDRSPKMIYSMSPFIDILVMSGVARYLEFRGISGFYISVPPNGASSIDGTIHFENPPISKSSIFRSTSLSLTEKRLLMKFLTHFVVKGKALLQSHPKDESIDKSLHHQIETPKDREPIRGVSSFLSQASIYSLEGVEWKSLWENKDGRNGTNDCEKDCWSSYLLENSMAIGLRQRITYGLCLKSTLDDCDIHSSPSSDGKMIVNDDKKKCSSIDWNIQQGLEQLFLLSSSFGRYSEGIYYYKKVDTVCSGSFVLPTFGSGDVAQAFTRLSAIYRGLFMLRTQLVSLIFKGEENMSSEQSCQKATDEQPEVLTDHPPELMPQIVNGKKLIGVNLSNGQRISIKRLVTSIDHLQPPQIRHPHKVTTKNLHTSRIIIVRVAAILNTRILPGDAGHQFCVCVHPNENPIHVLQLDQSSGSCLDDRFLVYLSQTIKAPSSSTVGKEFLVENCPQQYRSCVLLLHQLLKTKVECCLLLVAWTQNVRLTTPLSCFNDSVFVTPDPHFENMSTITTESKSAHQILTKLLHNVSTNIGELIPTPPHVANERREDHKVEASRMYNKLEEILENH